MDIEIKAWLYDILQLEKRIDVKYDLAYTTFLAWASPFMKLPKL